MKNLGTPKYSPYKYFLGLNGLHALLNLHSFDLDDYLKFPIEFLK